MKNKYIYKLTAAGLLIAVGIVIPMFSPLKIVMEPASFTLGSHIAIFIAMFIAPDVAVMVALGTTLGFFLGGFPVVIVLRAASHIVFTVAGALYLQRYPADTFSIRKAGLFSAALAVIHALCELAVVSVFYFAGNLTASYFEQGFIRSIILLVGFGTIVHSMVDFAIAYGVFGAVRKTVRVDR